MEREEYVGKWVTARKAGNVTRGRYYVDGLQGRVFDKGHPFYGGVAVYCHTNGASRPATLFDIRVYDATR